MDRGGNTVGRRWKYAALGPLVLACGCGGMKSTYEQQVREVVAASPASRDVITEADIAALPDPVQRFLRTHGYVGRGPFANAEVVWSESQIRMGPDRDWLDLTTHQFNSVPAPVRMAYMRARVFGIIPFEGMDTYVHGAGRMHMVLLKRLTVGDERGPEMNQSAAVTLLAEALLVPGYVLAPYITWEAIDDRSARATIRYQDTEASGVFHFDQADDFVRFTTEDRFAASDDGPRLVPWSAEVTEYASADGVRFPRAMHGIWHHEDGDFEYFRGRIEAIRYDVRN
jgi:hypothetical protein